MAKITAVCSWVLPAWMLAYSAQAKQAWRQWESLERRTCDTYAKPRCNECWTTSQHQYKYTCIYVYIYIYAQILHRVKPRWPWQLTTKNNSELRSWHHNPAPWWKWAPHGVVTPRGESSSPNDLTESSLSQRHSPWEQITPPGFKIRSAFLGPKKACPTTSARQKSTNQGAHRMLWRTWGRQEK